MNALLRAELLELRTTRTFLALTAAAVGVSALIAGLVAALTEPTRDSVLVDVFASDVSSLFILVLAVVGITGEWRHRTIAGSLLAAPDRLGFLAAKTLAYAAAGAVLSLVVAAAVTVVGVGVLTVRGLPLAGAGELCAQYGRNALLAALLGAFGVGVGAIVRLQVVAVVGLLVVAFAVEPAVLALAPEVGRFGPLGALSTAAAGIPGESVGMGGVDLLAPGLAVLGLLAWIAAAFAGGAALLRRRDVL